MVAKPQGEAEKPGPSQAPTHLLLLQPVATRALSQLAHTSPPLQPSCSLVHPHLLKLPSSTLSVQTSLQAFLALVPIPPLPFSFLLFCTFCLYLHVTCVLFFIEVQVIEKH